MLLGSARFIPTPRISQLIDQATSGNNINVSVLHMCVMCAFICECISRKVCTVSYLIIIGGECLLFEHIF